MKNITFLFPRLPYHTDPLTWDGGSNREASSSGTHYTVQQFIGRQGVDEKKTIHIVPSKCLAFLIIQQEAGPLQTELTDFYCILMGAWMTISVITDTFCCTKESRFHHGQWIFVMEQDCAPIMRSPHYPLLMSPKSLGLTLVTWPSILRGVTYNSLWLLQLPTPLMPTQSSSSPSLKVDFSNITKSYLMNAYIQYLIFIIVPVHLMCLWFVRSPKFSCWLINFCT